MRVLILDDDAARHQALAESLAGEDIEHCRTFQEAADAIRNDPYALVMVDHDLGYAYSKPTFDARGREFTGLDFAKLLVRLPHSQRPVVVVHSRNESGAMAIEALLLQHGFQVTREPFGGEYAT